MAQVQVKQIDGELILPLPADVQARLALTADSLIEVDLQGTEVVLRPQGAKPGRRSRYTLSELLADYDQIPRDADEDREWLNFPPAGRELL